jgi:hypothetical protein
MAWREGEPQTTDDGRPLKCRTCGGPLLCGEATYSIAYNYDRAEGEHWRCHVPIEDALRNVKNTLEKAQKQFDIIKRSLGE